MKCAITTFGWWYRRQKGEEMRLQNKVAVVTGGGRGIGRAIALAFAREGADVAVTGRTTTEIESVSAEINALGRVGVAIPVDFSQRDAIQPCVEQIRAHFPDVNILVNNAAIVASQNNPQYNKVIVEYDDDFWELSLFVNLTVPYLLMKAFLPQMIEKGWGRVINIAAGSGKRGAPRRGGYAASKHGLLGLTRTAALELATSGVTVNAICPGPFRTAMMANRIQYETEQLGKTIEAVEKSMNPMQRLLEPEELAELAVYMASDAARGMIGQAVNLGGGSIMH
jgi:meso-butanediol dehydrogenase/(S,S)-butanediol dehydrogenase/diacetyl reductase